MALLDAENSLAETLSDKYPTFEDIRTAELARLGTAAEDFEAELDAELLNGLPDDWEMPTVDLEGEDDGADGEDGDKGEGGDKDGDDKGTTDETGGDGDGEKGTEEAGATFMTASAAAIVLGAMLQ